MEEAINAKIHNSDRWITGSPQLSDNINNIVTELW